MAENVTVNSSGGANYTSIMAAYTAIKGGAGPDIIRIIGGGPYNEAITINTSVTIKGDGYRPILTVLPTSGTPSTTTDGNGIAIYTDATSGGDIEVTLQNLTVIPDKTTAPLRGLRSNNNASGLSTDNMVIHLKDFLMTSNNGSDQPVSTDGLSAADLTGATTFGDDHIFFSGYVSGSLDHVISTNGNRTSGSPDGVLFVPDDSREWTVGPGCVFSYMGRLGVQEASDGLIMRYNGTEGEPILIKGNDMFNHGNGGISIFHDCNVAGGSPDATKNEIFNWVYIIDNEAWGMTTYFADDTDGLAACVFNHCLIANNQKGGVGILDTLLLPWEFNNCTFYNNGTLVDLGYPVLEYATESVNSTGPVTFTNCIIAGDGLDDGQVGDNVIYLNPGTLNMGTVSLINCGLVLSGSYRLNGTGYTLAGSASAPNMVDCVNSDPQFLTMTTSSASYLFPGNIADYKGKTPFTPFISGIRQVAKAPLSSCTVNGTNIPSQFGDAQYLQTNQTGFSDNNNSDPIVSNGSELDGFYLANGDKVLLIGLTGNLENNGRAIQVVLNTDVATMPGIGLSTLPVITQTASEFRSFAGMDYDIFPFTANYAFVFENGSTGPNANWVDLSSGTPVGTDLGHGSAPASSYSGKVTYSNGIVLGMNSSNTAGVAAGNSVISASEDPGAVTNGYLVSIPFSLLGVDYDDVVQVMAYMSESTGSLSNQFLPGIYSKDGSGNLGGPNSANDLSIFKVGAVCLAQPVLAANAAWSLYE